MWMILEENLTVKRGSLMFGDEGVKKEWDQLCFCYWKEKYSTRMEIISH